MERRAFLAIFLSLVVMLGWWAFFGPAQPPVDPEAVAEQAAPGTGPAGPGGEAAPSPQTAPAPESAAGMSAADTEPPTEEPVAAAAEETLTVETGLATVVLTNRGARAVSWKLVLYMDDEGQPYELVSPAGEKAEPPTFPLHLRSGEEEIDRALDEALWQTERTTGNDGAQTVRFRWSDGRGLKATKTLTFLPDSYICRVESSVISSGRAVETGILWGPGIGVSLTSERTGTFDYVGRAVYGSIEGVERVGPGSLDEPTTVDGRPIRWAGVEEQYFSAIFLPLPGEEGLGELRIQPYTILPAPGESLESQLSVLAPARNPLRLYAGPKEYERLKVLAPGTGRLVDFGWAPLIGWLIGPIIEPLAKLLYYSLNWLYGLIPNYGVAIILLTTAIKVVFYPITQRAFVKMRRVQREMQALQPKVRSIRERFKKQKGAEARQKMNQEIMDLYRKEGVNPMGGMSGCLPLLIQLPFLYGFYNVLTVSIELRKAPFFGWITDLTQKDPLFVTPILMGLSMFIQQKMAMTKVTDPQQRAQQRMMLFMPVMFTFFFLNLPSGLTLYWFVSNLLQIGQQTLINRQADRVLETAGPPPKKKSAGSKGKQGGGAVRGAVASRRSAQR